MHAVLTLSQYMQQEPECAITISSGNWLKNQDSQNICLFFYEHFTSPDDKELLSHIRQYYECDLETHFKQLHFTGKLNQKVLIPVSHNHVTKYLICVGLGTHDKPATQQLEYFRRAQAHALLACKKYKMASIIIVLPDPEPYKISPEKLITEATTISHMSLYTGDRLKTVKKQDKKIKIILVIDEPENSEKLKQAKDSGDTIGNAVVKARALTDAPANIKNPQSVGTYIQECAQTYNLSCTIMRKNEIQKNNMGAFLAVTQGSAHDGIIAILEYKPFNNEDAPIIALVGKGVCFDAGGLNIKNTKQMKHMRKDIAGAAAVLGTMIALATLKPNVHVVGVMPLVDNMINSNAMHPGDIVTCMNGKTIEINNTDAEGRLILADTLYYAQQTYHPNVLIDIATLTGSTEKTFGPFYAGLFSGEQKLVDTFTTLGQQTGERVWHMPLDDDYVKAIESDSADLSNTSKDAYEGKSITASLFLRNFIETKQWAHLDISGVAKLIPDIAYWEKGASGFGVRLVTEFIMRYQKNNQ